VTCGHDSSYAEVRRDIVNVHYPIAPQRTSAWREVQGREERPILASLWTR
jgi:hypothetical protein